MELNYQSKNPLKSILGLPRLPKKILGSVGLLPLWGLGPIYPHFEAYGPPEPHGGGRPPDPKFFLGSLESPNRLFKGFLD